MNLTKLKELILKKASCYQDVVIDGQVLAKGMRNTCARRWEMLEPFIKDKKVYLDIGSDLGYFSQRIAQKCPESVVVSVEMDKGACDIQVEIMKALDLKNVVVYNYCFLADDFKRFSFAVEMIDTVFFLAVLHHYEADEQRNILKYCSQTIPEIIVEYVVQTGPGAWGGKAYLNFEEELKKYYDHVEIIGKSVSGPSESRILIRGWKEKITRDALDSVISEKVLESASVPLHKLIYSDGQWALKSKMVSKSNEYPRVRSDLVLGISVVNFFHFNPLWPLADWWIEQAGLAYNSLLAAGKQITDIHLPNLIFTPYGLKAIDYEHQGAPFNEVRTKQGIEKTIQDVKDKFNK